jgi:plasmid segregation protein ParM
VREINLKKGIDMSTNNQAETLRVIGQDDGHDTIKTCAGWDPATNKFLYGYHKSRAVQGLEQVMAVSRNGSSGGAYATEEQRFTIADGQSLLRSLDTRMDNYPLSALNRTLVNHALADCGLADTPIYLVTGLPVDQYYKNSAPNTEMIDAKIANLAKPVQRIGAGPGLAKISKQGVVSEAIAAFYDALIKPDGAFDAEIEALISRRPVGVVDMGGKTTDIVVIAENVRSVYSSRSGTANIGVLQLLDKVGERIKSEFQLNANPPTPYVEEACRTKRYELFGEEKDVSHIVEEACRELLAQVQNFFVSKVGDGSDLGAILFVGGGTALIQSALGTEAFASVYKGRRFIAKDPEYANARGMWKYGMFVVSPDERAVQKAEPVKAGRSSTVALAP